MPSNLDRRRKILINKDFQYRHALLTVSVIIIAVNLVVLASHLLVSAPMRYAPPWLELGVLAGLELAILGILVFFGLKESLSTAGPAHVMCRELSRLATGDLRGQVRFRSTDHFHEMATALNQASAALGERIGCVRAEVQRLSAISEDCPELRESIAEILKTLDGFTLSQNEKSPQIDHEGQQE